MSPHSLSALRAIGGVTLGLALSLAIAIAQARAGQTFEQLEVTVTAADPSLAQPDAEVWDVLAVRDVQVRSEVAEAKLDTTASVAIHLQTNATMDPADWRTIETVRVTEGLDVPPLMVDRELHATGERPLLRYLRWAVELSAPDPGQSVRFGVVGVARE